MTGRNFKNQSGVTLIEVLIYVGILSAVLSMLVAFSFEVSGASNKLTQSILITFK